tara:strand:+ start:128 stop:514 length:387 start_codon:yes stop_codon:yes gene_type:complete
MEKFLYFSDGTAGLDATTEGLCVKASLVKSMEPISATTSNIYFESTQAHKIDSVSTLDDSAGVSKFDYVQLTHTSGKFKEVATAVTQAINTTPHTDGFIVVCDALNSVFCSSLITDCSINYVDSNTAP